MKMSGTSRCSKVATSPRHDVPTSRRWGQLLCRSTSGNVATSQRRDVLTSRRPNFVTSKRRDVATSRRQREICPPSLKEKGVQNSRYRETYGLGHGNPK